LTTQIIGVRLPHPDWIQSMNHTSSTKDKSQSYT
jgi:hypothetical protein